MPRRRDRADDRPQWSRVLTALREAAGVTQDGWAAHLGYSRATVQRWERGELAPAADAEAAILRVCAERGLFRLLPGLDLTPESLRALLAAARIGADAPASDGRRTAPAPVPRPALRTPYSAVPHNLPATLTSFVGREEEVAEVRRLLAGTRLLTLTGAGGIGKTRLALRAAAQLPEGLVDEVRFVDLAALTDPALVPRSVAATLGLTDQPGRTSVEVVVEALRLRRLLLVLDNCEHLLAACADLAGALLAACPAVRILATSRAPLGVAGELAWRVPPLGVGSRTGVEGTSDDLPDAVRLLVDRAAAALPGFALMARTAPVAAQICRRLDGIPLAIELAAARVTVLTVEQIAARLNDRFRLLTGGNRTALPRHQTLRAALDWSYDLLAEPERTVLRRLAVFAGGCGVEAAEEVTGDRGQGTGDRGQGTGDRGQAGSVPTVPYPLFPVPSEDVLDILGALVDQSLLVADVQGEEARYRLLETVRQYALEKLREAGEEEAVRRRHATIFLVLAEQAAPQLVTASAPEWLARLDAEHDNLRSALAAADLLPPGGGLRLGASMWRFWQTRGHLTEGRAWLDRLLAQDGTPAAVRAAALFGAGTLAHDQGDYAGAVPYIEQSLVLARAAGQPAAAAGALLLLGALAWRRSDYSTATAHCEESLAIARTVDDRRLAGRCLNLLGLIALDQGRYAAAHGRFDEALALARGIGDLRTSAIALGNLGLTAHRQEEFARARAYLDEALTINRRLGNRPEIGRNLMTIAVVAQGAGATESALDHAREALAVAQEIGNRNGIAEALNQLTSISRQRGDLATARSYSAAHLQMVRDMRYPMQMLAAVWEAAANARAAGRPARAVRLIAASEAHREAVGVVQSSAMQRTMEEHLTSVRALLGEPAFATAWSAGATMSLEQAIEYALADEEERAVR